MMRFPPSEHLLASLPRFAFFEHHGTLYRKERDVAAGVLAEQCYPVPAQPQMVRFAAGEHGHEPSSRLLAGYKLFYRTPEDLGTP